MASGHGSRLPLTPFYAIFTRNKVSRRFIKKYVNLKVCNKLYSCLKRCNNFARLLPCYSSLCKRVILLHCQSFTLVRLLTRPPRLWQLNRYNQRPRCRRFVSELSRLSQLTGRLYLVHRGTLYSRRTTARHTTAMLAPADLAAAYGTALPFTGNLPAKTLVQRTTCKINLKRR